MKKLMGFLFVLVFIFGIIFVLLPFLETTPPPSAVPAPQARPRPQIFTSNPLTTLVKRIVNALQTEWDKKREKRRLAVARMQEKRKLAPTNYRAALLKTLPSQEEAPGEPIELPQGEDDGNWLIAPQISPEDMGVKGMHEVNTDEELPHSAEMQATEQPLQALPLVSPTEENASFSAQKEPLLLARANTNLQLPKPARYAPEPTKTQAPLSETEKALKELMDVVYPERRLAKLVEDYASVKFGLVPATPASLKEKEAFIKEKKEQVIKEFRRLQWEDIMRMLDSQEPPPPPAKDYLGNYVRAAKREGKETIDLPITIVYEEDGKVLSAGIPSVDAEKLQKVVVAKTVGKVSDPNASVVAKWYSRVKRYPIKIAAEAAENMNNAIDKITSKGTTPPPATGEPLSNPEWEKVMDVIEYLTTETVTISPYFQDNGLVEKPTVRSLSLEQTQETTSTPAKKPNKTEEIANALTKYVRPTETGTSAQTNSGQDDRPVGEPTVPPSSSEPTQGTPTPATGDQPFKEMWEKSIKLAEDLKTGGFPLLLQDGYVSSVDIMRYAQGAVLGLNEEEKNNLHISEKDIRTSSSQHPWPLLKQWEN